MTADSVRPIPHLPDLETIRRVHIVGICGTAMGTLAAMFKERGFAVTGSDRGAYPPMSDWLGERGLDILPGWDAANIPTDCDIVVIGNVVRRQNPEALSAHERGLPMISLPEALRLFFFGDRKALVITGTHGKTTTASMAAWMLSSAGRDPSFFIGGVTQNFQSNYGLGLGPFVIEGDEYDTAYFDKVPKFWHYPAKFATINNVEFDHADIYRDIGEIEGVFQRFAAQVDPAGELWVYAGDERAMKCAAGSAAPVRTFGWGSDVDHGADLLSTEGHRQRVRLHAFGETLGVFELPFAGRYNILNFLGASGILRGEGLSLTDCAHHVQHFAGVRKRLDVRGEVADIVVLDDFAHHPRAVHETLRAIRAMYPGRRLLAAFEAKSNTSRRAVFQQDYAEAFSDVDALYLSRPFRRDDDLPATMRLSLPKLMSDVRARGVIVCFEPDVSVLAEVAANDARPGDIIAGLSGGDFSGFHDAVLAALRERHGLR